MKGPARSLDELARATGAIRPDRLAAWIAVGVELGELAERRNGTYRIQGCRRD